MAQGGGAAAAADDASRLLFWPAQDELARALLMAGDAKEAYAVVTAAAPPEGLTAAARSQIGDRDFLAGFLALRFLKRPDQARQWFTDLANASTAVITQARAYYWRARTENGAVATADYGRAAAYPDTYYGQLAALALGDTPQGLANRVLAAGEPAFTAADALDFAIMELPRAAALLVQMNDPRDAAVFLNRLGQTGLDDQTRELAARLALGLGLPQSAVSIARTAGIAGQDADPAGLADAVPAARHRRTGGRLRHHAAGKQFRSGGDLRRRRRRVDATDAGDGTAHRGAERHPVWRPS